jgi:hypothetical protein
MAWVYSLSSECGPDKTRAEAFARHFEGLSFGLATGKTSACSAVVHSDEETNWWVHVCPNNVTRSGGSSLTDAIEISEIGFRLYKHLKSAPPFRFALFGCEVEEFRLYSELADDVAIYRDGRTEFNNSPAFNGLVLSRDAWETLGKPIAFFPFAGNYRWRPYGGKEHSVILDDEEYGRLLRGLQDELYPKDVAPGDNT